MNLLLIYLILVTFGDGSSSVYRKLSHIAVGSGRVSEIFSAGFLDTLDQETRRRLNNQNEMDEANDAYCPNTKQKSWEFTILGNITLGPVVARGPYSVLFEIIEYPQYLIKYQVNCEEDSIHQLLREYWYGGIASDRGISPSILFVSPPVLLCPRSAGKCATKLDLRTYNACYNTIGNLRYMLVDKVRGVDLNRYRSLNFPDSNMGIHNAVVIGLKLIEELEKLHEDAKIVHGDIYHANVMVLELNGTDARIQLIDFGRAFPASDQLLPQTPIFPVGHWLHELCTHWQIAGYAWARRDDIMKAIHTMFQLMHPRSFILFERELYQKGSGALMDWKARQRMYVSLEFDPVASSSYSHSTKTALYSYLDTILAIVRGLGINEPVPYKNLTEILQIALAEIS